MGKRLLDLEFPLAGLDRAYSYRAQRPYSTPDALNVRATDVFEGRERGGSRPGLGKAYYDQLGSGNPIRMLASLGVVKNDGLDFWSDEFQGTALGDSWSNASWMGSAVPSILPNAAASVAYTAKAGAVRTALASIDTSKAYQIEMFISPYEGEHHGDYYLLARMNNSTPAGETDGAVAKLTMTGSGGVYSGSLKVYVAGVATTYAFTGGTVSSAQGGWFRMLITANNVKCYWMGNLLVNQNISAAAGSRVGFGMEATVAGGICLVESFRAQWYKTGTIEQYRNMLLASSNGVLYKEGMLGSLEAVSSNLTLASDRQIMAVEHLQKLYIADYGDPRIIGTGGAGDIDATGLELTDSPTITDWTTYGIDPHDDVVVITDGTGAVVDGTYKISSVASGKVVLTATAGGAGTCNYRIERAPKIYDPVANTLSIWTATAGKGQVPTGCPVIARYRGRIVLIKDNTWYMSRQDDPLDWDYGADDDDVQRAVAGSSAEAGRVGEIHTAAIPHTDDYMILGCSNSLWLLRGDPAYGGQLDNISQHIGIVDKMAWCRGPNGETVFLGNAGLYSIAPGGVNPPEQLSDKLPQELRNVSLATHSISMAYDAQDEGVHIFLSPNAGNSQLHWWFDIKNKAFWPVRLATTSDPIVALAYVGRDPADNAVLLGCRDGYVRRFRDSWETDETAEIESWVKIGPIRAAGDYFESVLDELVGALALDSGDITWSIFAGNTHEDAVKAVTARATGSWVAGLNYTQHPRVRCGSFLIKIENKESRAWALERMTLGVFQSGKQRLA